MNPPDTRPLMALLGARLAAPIYAAEALRRDGLVPTVDAIVKRLQSESARVHLSILCQRGHVEIRPGGVVRPLIDLRGRRVVREGAVIGFDA